MKSSESILQRIDYILMGTTLLLIVFGVLMIRSATQDAVDPDLIRRVPDQIQFAVIGFFVMIGVMLLDYRLLGGLHTWLYMLMVIMLLMVVFFGVEGDAGARRWINVGILIQPSEVGKILIIITLAQYFSQRYKRMDNFMTVIGSIMHVAVPVALIFIQPDLGTTIVFLIIWAVIIWGAGIRLQHLVLLFTAALLALPLLFSQLQPYQVSRITTFLDPGSDPDAQYNIDQALISIGSGGVFGKGYAVGPQNTGRFLRVRHTDFIFSVIAHEFGLAGGLTITALFGVMILRILRGARIAQDTLGSLICYGVAGMIFFQTVVSIGMNLAVLPVTGLTLPLISSGGTSLLFTMVGIGLVESVIIRRRRIV